ncbi:glycogen/starch/alpha-glucan phosphorylase, partial [uncultured Actinomyces sp.]|uniref:glycogen/starch/alpha-glucan phosphorylase n=1 Tax=uncultured Actinomyces sp. TaxID=249061 RepID=UPI0028038EEC
MTQKLVTSAPAQVRAVSGRPETAATLMEVWQGLSAAVVDTIADDWYATEQKYSAGRQEHYFSAEFLMGRALLNNLSNLGMVDEAREAVGSFGVNLSDVLEQEPDAALGNGGLGRLAACFLDSIATLGLNGDGIGLNYHFGLFKQLFKDNLQDEEPNPWIKDASWLTKTDVTYKIPYKGFTLTSRMYDIQVTGYGNRTNTLHLFDVETVDESLVTEGISFDKKDIRKNLTLFLYPDDSDKAGQVLRICQQYFMVSNAARLILSEALGKGSSLYDLPDYAVIQINDTHPTMVIPELIRLLTTEHGMEMDDAIQVVSRTCAYTNHTILAEALEKWPRAYLDAVVPQLMPIIEKLDALAHTRTKDESLA